ncbi:MAG: hypothetical protein ACE364_06915 [Chlorobiota bacterium]
MTTTEIIIAITIHLVIPLIGFIAFLKVRKNIKKANIEDSLSTNLFLVFATYGGLLLIVLTNLFWRWSAMASLGMFYLILVAPFIMGFIAYKYYKQKEVSIYHLRIYKAGCMYFVILLSVFGLPFFFQ